MAKLMGTQLFPTTSKLADPTTKAWGEKLTRMLDNLVRKIASIPFNRSESLDVADTGGANAQFTVTHHLSRVPSGFIVTKSDAACAVYDSGTTWTTTVVYLKCNAANVAITITLF